MAENKIAVNQIGENIWQFNEAQEMNGAVLPYVDAYLICGEKRALLVDTLMKESGLFDSVREITPLPLDVVLTHGHMDHAGASMKWFHEAGTSIFMDLRDLPILASMPPNESGIDEKWFTPAKDGMVFDLGGQKFEIIAVPGHSPGSLVLIDRDNQLLFSGDSIGSGHFWMQIPTALPLDAFLVHVTRLYEQTRELKNLLVYPGHRNQSPVQLTGQYVKDALTITKRILDGVMVGEDKELNLPHLAMKYKSITYGQYVSYCYDPQNLRYGRPDPALEALKQQFTFGEIKDGATRLAYRFFSPAVQPGEQYPLVIYLHGGGERGDDNQKSLAIKGGTAFAAQDWQNDHPCFVFVPQCPENMLWTHESHVKLIIKAIADLPMQFPIDRNRIYLTGLSLGSMGSWNLISRYPDLFAAAMPICGAGDPIAVKNAKNVPVWAFHAADDPVVPVSGKWTSPAFPNLFGTRTLVAALRSTGNRHVRYTEFEPGYMGQTWQLHPHFSWVPAYENIAAREWLFSHSRYDRYKIEAIMPGVWSIDDFSNSSFYVVEGQDQALVIDTGMGGGDVVGLVRSLTRLPFKLAVTHAHMDHLYHGKKFGPFYLNPKEEVILKDGFTRDDFIPVTDGDPIDLGGGVVIETLEISGHSPGSVAFLDRFHNLCFTGDAVGSGCGVWMQVPGATSLSQYQANLVGFANKLQAEGLDDLCFLGGHRNQEQGFPAGSTFNPLTRKLIEDMAVLCDKIIHDDVDFKPFNGRTFGEPAFQASFGAADMIFTESIRK